MKKSQANLIALLRRHNTHLTRKRLPDGRYGFCYIANGRERIVNTSIAQSLIDDQHVTVDLSDVSAARFFLNQE